MRTINPLFVDSTKPIGDKVVTNVELLNIILHDGDSVYFEMVNEFGFAQRFLLQKVETKKSVKFQTEVWLKYQFVIQYRFFIEAKGEEVFTSSKRETRAGHIISDKWEPCLNADPLVDKNEKRNARREEFIKEIKAPREPKVNASKALVKPQFFDQIRSLIDDLM